MEQEKILSTLTEKLGETSFSPQTLQKYVELNPVAEGSEPDETYWNNAVGFLKGMQGQYNHDVATRVEDFKKNDKPQQSPSNGEEKTEGGALAVQVEELKNELSQLKKEREEEKNAASVHALMEQSRSQLKSLIENDGKNTCNEEILNIAISDVDITDGMKQEDIVNCAKRNYEKRYKAIFGNGASPSINQFSQASEEQTNSRRESFKERMRAQGKLPKKK